MHTLHTLEKERKNKIKEKRSLLLILHFYNQTRRFSHLFCILLMKLIAI